MGEHGCITQGVRRLEYWSACEDCPDRKACQHDCDHPGWMRFMVGGRRRVFWSGIIDRRKVARTAKDYLGDSPPEDVWMEV